VLPAVSHSGLTTESTCTDRKSAPNPVLLGAAISGAACLTGSSAACSGMYECRQRQNLIQLIDDKQIESITFCKNFFFFFSFSFFFLMKHAISNTEEERQKMLIFRIIAYTRTILFCAITYRASEVFSLFMLFRDIYQAGKLRFATMVLHTRRLKVVG